MGQGSKSLLQ